MDICACMYTQNVVGDSVCNRCRGDIYACECPMVHSIRCPDHPDFRCDFCYHGMKSSDCTKLCHRCEEERSAMTPERVESVKELRRALYCLNRAMGIEAGREDIDVELAPIRDKVYDMIEMLDTGIRVQTT